MSSAKKRKPQNPHLLSCHLKSLTTRKGLSGSFFNRLAQYTQSPSNGLTSSQLLGRTVIKNNPFFVAHPPSPVTVSNERIAPRPMQPNAKAGLFLFWVSPATLLRGLTTYAGRRQILGGVFCAESNRMV
jgi:hypothetical protein